MSRMSNKLIEHWQNATPEARQAGLHWYTEARAQVARMAKEHGVSKACAAGCIAATSPRLRWSVNLRVADTLLGGIDPRGVFRTSLRKARRIKAGEKPLSVLSGPKVRAFYRALMGSNSAAVVDVWVTRAVGWTKRVTALAYARIATALAKAAEVVGASVVDLQATAWVVVRGSAA